jgi:hypothetical protein
MFSARKNTNLINKKSKTDRAQFDRVKLAKPVRPAAFDLLLFERKY